MQKSNNLFHWTPVLGILLFFGLYWYAATLYPGGSQMNATSIGFDWVNNYWCDLLGEKGANGMVNSARPIAITAMTILCLSLIQFFWQFANKLAPSKIWANLIKICGIISMSPTVLGIVKGIYQSQLTFFKISGLIGLFLLAANNYIYHTTHLLEWLPLLQKISFLIILCWMIGLSIKMIYGYQVADIRSKAR